MENKRIGQAASGAPEVGEDLGIPTSHSRPDQWASVVGIPGRLGDGGGMRVGAPLSRLPSTGPATDLGRLIHDGGGAGSRGSLPLKGVSAVGLGRAGVGLTSVLAIMPSCDKEKECVGRSEPAITYLTYIRSGTTRQKIKDLASQFCENNTYSDGDLKEILTEEAQGFADQDCVPTELCHCAGTSSPWVREAQLSEKEASILAIQLKLVGRNAAKPLDPADPRVPEADRVYISVECGMKVSGNCDQR